MAKYKKCPRCEMNYILESEDYCQICKAELKGMAVDIIVDDNDGEDVLCPNCGVHFLNPGEVICESCAQKLKEKKLLEDAEEEDIFEKEDEIPAEVDDDDDEVSLEGLVEEESDSQWEEDKFDDEMPDADEVI